MDEKLIAIVYGCIFYFVDNLIFFWVTLKFHQNSMKSNHVQDTFHVQLFHIQMYTLTYPKLLLFFFVSSFPASSFPFLLEII